MEKVYQLLKSTRFWATVIAVAGVVVNEVTGKPLDEATLNQMVVLILGFIGARTVTDVAYIKKQ